MPLLHHLLNFKQTNRIPLPSPLGIKHRATCMADKQRWVLPLRYIFLSCFLARALRLYFCHARDGAGARCSQGKHPTVKLHSYFHFVKYNRDNNQQFSGTSKLALQNRNWFIQNLSSAQIFQDKTNTMMLSNYFHLLLVEKKKSFFPNRPRLACCYPRPHQVRFQKPLIFRRYHT